MERSTVYVSDDTGRVAMLEVRNTDYDADGCEDMLTRYVYSNHLQSATLELDAEGDIISYEEYHPFGTTAYQAKNASINAVAKRYRYTGKERDEESGLYYHGGIANGRTILGLNSSTNSSVEASIETITKAETKLLPEGFHRFSKFESHFIKHSKEWGAITREAYYKRALSLMDGGVGGDVGGFTNSSSYTFRMNMKTGEFGVMRPNGVIESFFRRITEPVAYWATKIYKYGK